MNRLIVLVFASLGVMFFSAVGVKETLGLPLDEIEVLRKRHDDDDGGYWYCFQSVYVVSELFALGVLVLVFH